MELWQYVSYQGLGAQLYVHLPRFGSIEQKTKAIITMKNKSCCHMQYHALAVFWLTLQLCVLLDARINLLSIPRYLETHQHCALDHLGCICPCLLYTSDAADE